MNKLRKAKLSARALAYSSANHERGADSISWEDGYRAAMRDARKAIAADIDIRKPTPASGHKGAAWDIFPTIRAFLLPLR